MYCRTMKLLFIRPLFAFFVGIYQAQAEEVVSNAKR